MAFASTRRRCAPQDHFRPPEHDRCAEEDLRDLEPWQSVPTEREEAATPQTSGEALKHRKHRPFRSICRPRRRRRDVESVARSLRLLYSALSYFLALTSIANVVSIPSECPGEQREERRRISRVEERGKTKDEERKTKHAIAIGIRRNTSTPLHKELSDRTRQGVFQLLGFFVCYIPSERGL